MSLRWMLVLAAELGFVGIGTMGIAAQPVRATDATASPAVAAAVLPAAPGAESVARLPKQLRSAVADAMRRANMAKGSDRAAAIQSLLDVYRDLGRDVLLPAKERLRLGVQVRTRLQRFASQFRYETAHGLASNAKGGDSQTGASGGPAVQGLDSLVELIQTTVARPDDWVAAQQAGNMPGLAGGVGVGFGVAGAARGGGFGNNDALDKGAAANGADLVDLIQKTVDPPSWDVNGGVGSIMYFNNLRVLVVRQTAEGQDDIGGVLGGLRNH